MQDYLTTYSLSFLVADINNDLKDTSIMLLKYKIKNRILILSPSPVKSIDRRTRSISKLIPYPSVFSPPFFMGTGIEVSTKIRGHLLCRNVFTFILQHLARYSLTAFSVLKLFIKIKGTELLFCSLKRCKKLN